MYCIQLIWRSGGSSSVIAETVEDVRKKAALKVNSKEHIVATVPFEVFKAAGFTNAYDCSIPAEFRQALGGDVLKLYSQSD